MKQLRKAAARERRIPILWWLFLMVGTGGALVAVIHRHWPPMAWLVAILLAVAWAAPIVAFQSMIPPRRAQDPMPASGEGSYDEWLKQARRIGRTLIYYEENREIPPELRLTLHIANHDLRDTLKAHPLRDDLERVCRRLTDGAIREMKDWLWGKSGSDIREVLHQYESDLACAVDENDRLIALQTAVENAAATMSRRCMPRMLERERLICARDCAWLAAQVANGHGRHLSPIQLAAALVIEWSDFSTPWKPARMLRRATVRLAAEEVTHAPAPAGEPVLVPEQEATGVEPKKYRRVRVKVRRKHHHSRPYRGPSILEILLSFGQWLRYSVRSWMLYR
jgi:hypothetical protein